MVKEFQLYTKSDCLYCEKAKNLISSRGDKYNELTVGLDINRNALLALFPEAKSVPQIVLLREDGVHINDHIGGYDELLAWYYAKTPRISKQDA
jgi:glutaredoxin 3